MPDDAYRQPDLKERMEVLIAANENLKARLLSVEHPEYMLDQAIALENHANELLAKAKRIRDGIDRDTLLAESLRKQVKDNNVQIGLLRYFVLRGKPLEKYEYVLDYLRREIAWQKQQLTQPETTEKQDDNDSNVCS